MKEFKDIKIAVAGTGYVGLSIATLLSQHHQVTAVDVIPEKVEKLNKHTVLLLSPESVRLSCLYVLILFEEHSHVGDLVSYLFDVAARYLKSLYPVEKF